MQRPVDDSAQDERIREWIRANVGGEVVSLVRQARWRPVWFVDVDRDGERLEPVSYTHLTLPTIYSV